MHYPSPNALALYAAATNRQTHFNDARRRCPGCATMRSVGQFQPSDSEYCLRCTRRGICAPKESRRHPATEAGNAVPALTKRRP